MAGEWIKFEAATPEKPEVFAITAALGWDDPDLTVGKLLKIWRWFDQQTVDGYAPNVTLALLDRIAGVTGFAQAMGDVGWLLPENGGICLPHFDSHNGKTAKSRAQTAKRMAVLRAKGGSDAGGDAGIVTPASPRKEKRRKNHGAAPTFDPMGVLVGLGVAEQIAQDWLVLRAGKRAPVTSTALEQIREQAAKAGVSLEAALAYSCSQGWAGFKAAWVKDAQLLDGVAAKPKDWQ